MFESLNCFEMFRWGRVGEIGSILGFGDGAWTWDFGSVGENQGFFGWFWQKRPKTAQGAQLSLDPECVEKENVNANGVVCFQERRKINSACWELLGNILLWIDQKRPKLRKVFLAQGRKKSSVCLENKCDQECCSKEGGSGSSLLTPRQKKIFCAKRWIFSPLAHSGERKIPLAHSADFFSRFPDICEREEGGGLDPPRC